MQTYYTITAKPPGKPSSWCWSSINLQKKKRLFRFSVNL